MSIQIRYGCSICGLKWATYEEAQSCTHPKVEDGVDPRADTPEPLVDEPAEDAA